MRYRNPAWLLAGAILAAGLAGGCGPKPQAPEPTIPCYLESPGALMGIARAVLVEPPSDPSTAVVARDVAQALARTIAARQIFQVDLALPGEIGLDIAALDGRRTVTLEQMKTIRDTLQCDVVILTAMTEFHAYPRMRMGLRMQMLDLRSGRLLWSLDHVWDGTEEATAKRIQNYHTTRTPGMADPLEWRVALVSPKAFGEFVAADVARTLSPTNVVGRAKR